MQKLLQDQMIDLPEEAHSGFAWQQLVALHPERGEEESDLDQSLELAGSDLLLGC